VEVLSGNPVELPVRDGSSCAVLRPMSSGMEAADFAVIRGLGDTRQVLARWNADPWPVVRGWLAAAGAIAAALLAAVLVVACLATPDSTPVLLPGLNANADLDAVGGVLARNSLVLALHAFACLAGFIAGSSLPMEAERYRGWWRTIHDRAGPLAIAFVSAATLFSLVTQAYVLGNAASTLASQGGMAPVGLLVGILPHAALELVALFLPLAAWIIASRRGDWHELLAATLTTVALAVPLLVAAAFVEVYVSPGFILALRG
jgi:stage II sporulation SpoM-like protein